ncbi:MAG: hypothetical protein RLZZ387_2315 [Chloroflexota bacterium]
MPLQVFGDVVVKDLGSGAEQPCDSGGRTPGYAEAVVRLRVRAVALFGNVEVIRVPPMRRLRPGEAPSGGVWALRVDG